MVFVIVESYGLVYGAAMMTPGGLSKCRNGSIVSMIVAGLAYRCFGFNAKVCSSIILTLWSLVLLCIAAEAILYKEISIGGESVTKDAYPRSFLLLTVFILLLTIFILLADIVSLSQMLRALGAS